MGDKGGSDKKKDSESTVARSKIWESMIALVVAPATPQEYREKVDNLLTVTDEEAKKRNFPVKSGIKDSLKYIP